MSMIDTLRIQLELDLSGAKRDLRSALKDIIQRAQRMREDLDAEERLETTLMKNKAEIDVLADRINRLNFIMVILGQTLKCKDCGRLRSDAAHADLPCPATDKEPCKWEEIPDPSSVNSPARAVPTRGGRR